MIGNDITASGTGKVSCSFCIETSTKKGRWLRRREQTERSHLAQFAHLYNSAMCAPFRQIEQPVNRQRAYSVGGDESSHEIAAWKPRRCLQMASAGNGEALIFKAARGNK
jgi:hypothetical protein